MAIDKQTSDGIDKLVQENLDKATAAQKSVASKEASRRKIAGVLIEINTFLQSTAQTRDFFKGYSLAEAIKDRLDFIGGGKQNKTQAPNEEPTLLGELEKLLLEGKEAIAQAKEAIKDEDAESETIASDEPVELDDTTMVMESD